MCFRSGGGGNGGAAQREQARQRRQNIAIADINRLFGIYEPYPSAPATPSGGIFKQFPKPPSPDQSEIDARRAEAERNRAAREESYADIGQSVRDYYISDLDLQQQMADRQRRFAVARRGVAGGSSDIDTSAELLRDYNRAVLDIGNRADQAANEARAADEQARLDLIQRILSGMSGDAAIQSANVALRNNISDARSNALSQRLGQVFRNYGQVVTADAERRGRYRGGGGIYYNPANYSGEVS